VLFQKEWKNRSVEETAPDIAKLLDEHNPILIKVDDKPVEYRGKVEKFTRKKIHYIDASRRETDIAGRLMTCKDHMMGQLQRKNREHHLIISQKFVDLIIQMRKYRRGMDRGNDLVDGLALACYEPSEPFQVKPIGRIIFGKTKLRQYTPY